MPRREENAALAVCRPGFQTGIVPQAELGWPTIPGVTYTGLITTRYWLDFGPDEDNSVLSKYPPSLEGRPAYPIFVSKVDEDGNEAAGVRLPQVAAPIATTTGWALRREGFGKNDGGESDGQNIPFKTTKAERLAAGDPRRSLEERYQDHEGYVKAVTKAAKELEKRRFLLPDDVSEVHQRGARQRHAAVITFGLTAKELGAWVRLGASVRNSPGLAIGRYTVG